MAARLLVLLAASAFALGAQTCTFTISVSQQSFPQAGGSATVTITASNSSCQRSVVSSDSRHVITFGQQGTGSGQTSLTGARPVVVRFGQAQSQPGVTVAIQ